MSDNVKTLNAVEQLQIAQDRISELQNIIYLLQQPELHNKIKAEGIRKMFEHYGTRHPTEREIDEWIDKLEKGGD